MQQEEETFHGKQTVDSKQTFRGMKMYKKVRGALCSRRRVGAAGEGDLPRQADSRQTANSNQTFRGMKMYKKVRGALCSRRRAGLTGCGGGGESPPPSLPGCCASPGCCARQRALTRAPLGELPTLGFAWLLRVAVQLYSIAALPSVLDLTLGKAGFAECSRFEHLVKFFFLLLF